MIDRWTDGEGVDLDNTAQRAKEKLGNEGHHEKKLGPGPASKKDTYAPSVRFSSSGLTNTAA